VKSSRLLPDNVIIIKLSSSKRLIFINASTPHSQIYFYRENQLVINGTSSSVANKTGKINFKTVAFPVLKGGKLTSSKR
jgi:alpha-L-fucosidase 2